MHIPTIDFDAVDELAARQRTLSAGSPTPCRWALSTVEHSPPGPSPGGLRDLWIVRGIQGGSAGVRAGFVSTHDLRRCGSPAAWAETSVRHVAHGGSSAAHCHDNPLVERVLASMCRPRWPMSTMWYSADMVIEPVESRVCRSAACVGTSPTTGSRWTLRRVATNRRASAPARGSGVGCCQAGGSGGASTRRTWSIGLIVPPSSTPSWL